MGNVKNSISTFETVGPFLKKGCAPALFHVISRAFDHPMTDEERATAPLMGGIMQHGYQCGQLWGATLAAGAQIYRELGTGPAAEAKAIVTAQKLVESFRARNKEIDCGELTGLDETSSNMQLFTHFLLKGGTARCCAMGAKYAPVAFGDINTTLADDSGEALPSPISCTAELAKKAGASDMHVAMVAGFAGGIGFSGGACGALGAAIWLSGLNRLKQGDSEVSFKSPDASEAIHKFMKSSGNKFECARIVGRKFESIEDHSAYLCNGGCAEIIDALAALLDKKRTEAN